MGLKVGDRVEEQARSTARAGRVGVIREVVRGDPAPRYRILWDDEHESVYTPAAGCLRPLAPAERPVGRNTASTTSTAGKQAARRSAATKTPRKPR